MSLKAKIREAIKRRKQRIAKRLDKFDCSGPDEPMMTASNVDVAMPGCSALSAKLPTAIAGGQSETSCICIELRCRNALDGSICGINLVQMNVL